jgi:hypothetical protein
MFEDLKDADNAARTLRNTGIIYYKNEKYEQANNVVRGSRYEPHPAGQGIR